MEVIIRARRDVGVVAEESSTEAVTGVDRVRAHQPGLIGSEIAHRVAEPRIVDEVTERGAVDPADRRWGSRGTGLPRRDDIRGVGSEVHLAAGGDADRREEGIDTA